ncbi:MAG: hypothetical protein CUN56_09525 [Phototrophicales bacterium]|nr:MAG: hypothetical protein CUN56_09525 [Phototrophicales bacterium]
MSLGRAFNAIFNDPDWVSKLIIIVILAFASIVLMPMLLAGLIPLAMILGYMLGIINNVRNGKKIVLPRWDNYGDLLARGSGVLVAILVYNLPVMLLGCCFWFLPSLAGSDSFVQGGVLLTLLCCSLPFILIHSVLSWTFLAAGMNRYAKGDTTSVFFQVGLLWDDVAADWSISLQWMLMALMINIITAVLIAIPCIGWVTAPAILYPVHAHLIGQYGRCLPK